MIKQDFFEAAIQYDQQQDQSYDYILTKELAPYNSTDYTTYQEVDTDTYPGAYYLGWMKYENIPTSFLLSGATKNTESSIMTTTTPTNNYNIGYIARYSDSDSLAAYKIASTSMVADGKWKTCIGNTSSYLDGGCNFWQTYRFPNRFNVGCINYDHLHVCYALINMDDQTAAPIYFQMDVNAEDFETWITATYQVTISGMSTFDLLNGVINENYFQQVEIDGVGYRVVIFSYQCFADRPVDRSGDTFAYLSLSPNINLVGSGVDPTAEGAVAQAEEINTSCTGAYYYTLNGTGVDVFSIGQARRTNSIGVASPDGQYYPANNIYDYPNWDSYVILPNGYNGTFERAKLIMTTRGFMWGDNCFDYCDGSAHILVRMYKTSDIIHHASILPRWKGKSTDPATHGLNFDPEEVSVYYPEVLETNEFTGRLVTGTPEELEEILRPWQFDPDDWENEPYRPEDIPPYEPPGPDVPIEPPNEGDWGPHIPQSRVTMGGNPFSQFEQLTYEGLEEFIANLWHAPQTFWEALSASKELSANLNDYLISCRAYPIFINGAFQHHDIYVGIGGKITLQNDIFTPSIVSLCACGEITVNRHYGSFLDYSPYTSATIYLPYAGTFEINPKYLYDSVINLKLYVDLTDGSGVWVLRNESRGYPILIKQCQVGVDIPISGLDAAQKGANIVNATLTTAQHAISGFKNIVNAGAAIGGAVMSGGMTAGAALSVGEGLANTAIQGLSDSYNMAMANKELPYYSTGSAGAAAAEANTEPFITLRIPLSENPSNFSHTVGNLVNKTSAISALSGFTICRNVDTGGISSATEKEKSQIKKIMENGFYA